MTDTLRDRIAILVYDTVAWRDVHFPVATEVADAVIAALGLRQEWMSHPADGTRDIRYVTEWEPDD